MQPQHLPFEIKDRVGVELVQQVRQGLVRGQVCQKQGAGSTGTPIQDRGMPCQVWEGIYQQAEVMRQVEVPAQIPGAGEVELTP